MLNLLFQHSIVLDLEVLEVLSPYGPLEQVPWICWKGKFTMKPILKVGCQRKFGFNEKIKYQFLKAFPISQFTILFCSFRLLQTLALVRILPVYSIKNGCFSQKGIQKMKIEPNIQIKGRKQKNLVLFGTLGQGPLVQSLCRYTSKPRLTYSRPWRPTMCCRVTADLIYCFQLFLLAR